MNRRETPLYDSDYLQLTKLLESQSPESEKHGFHTHDEMLFIITHQVYELFSRFFGRFAPSELEKGKP